jgi:HEPN domain-containing protein
MLPKQTSDKNPADWFVLAQERIDAADTLWANDGLTMTGIECLQEGVERFLKGYLIAKGWRLVKTHDLERLVKEAIVFNEEFSKFEPFAMELTNDFFAQHYPGADMTNVGVNYEKMRTATAELISEIRNQIPNFFPQ